MLLALQADDPDRKSYAHGQVAACLVRAIARAHEGGLAAMPIHIDSEPPQGFDAYFRLKKPCGKCKEKNK